MTVHDPNIPEFIEKTWGVSKVQKALIRILIEKERFSHTTAIVNHEIIRMRLLKICKGIGKWSLLIKRLKADISKKRPREEDQGPEPPVLGVSSPGPSADRVPRAGDQGSPSLKRFRV